MSRSIAFWMLWLGFIAYAFLLAPPNDPQTFTLIKNLSTGQWDGINPLVIAVFNTLGLLPLAYSCLMLFDGRGQKVRAFPFVMFSFGVGAFAILPYLALRRPNPKFEGAKSRLLKVLDSRWMGGAIALTTLALLTFGIVAGDWSDFVQQWQTSRFVHVMSLDLCLLSLLPPALLGDDLSRRGLDDRRILWGVSLVPLLGLLVYLTLRPPLKVSSETAVSNTVNLV